MINNKNATNDLNKADEKKSETRIFSAADSENERRSVSWDINNAFGNYFALIVAQGCVAIFSFLTVWLLNRFIGTDGYGNVVAVIAASQIIQVVIGWTTIAVSKFGTEDFVATGVISRSFWNRTYFLVLNMTLVLLASFVWFEPISSWLKIQTDFFIYVVAHIIVTIFWMHMQFALQGAKLVRAQGILIAVEKLIVLLCVLFFILSGSMSWTLVFSAYILAPFIMIMIGGWYLRTLIFPVGKLELLYIKKILIYCLPLLPYSLIGYFSTSYIDVFFISQYLTKKDVGVYAITYQITGILMQLPVLAGNVLFPMFVTMQSNVSYNNQINLYFTKILPSICYAWTIGCALFAFFGGIIMPLVFGENFSDIYVLLWIMMGIAGIGGPILWGYGVIANAKSLTYISTVNAVITASLNVVLNYLLIPRYGLVGCGWASLIASFCGTSAFILLVNKSLKIKRNAAILVTLPLIFGAGFITFYRNTFLALAVTILIGSFYLAVNRKTIFEVFQMLRQKLILQFSGKTF